MHKLYTYLSCIFFLFVTFVHANTALDGKPVKQIDLIITSDNEEAATAEEQTILKSLKTQVGTPFSQATFDQDLKNLSKRFDQVHPTFYEKQDEVIIKIILQPKPVIEKITIEGNEYFSSSKLLKELGISSGTILDRQEFNTALNKIKDLYLKKGFFESEVSYRVDQSEAKADIIIKIHEGKAALVNDIVFHGVTAAEQKAIVPLLYTKKYNKFVSWMTGMGYLRNEALEQDEMIVLHYLQNQGYADAKLDTKVTENPKQRMVDIIFTIQRGPLYHFGQATFEGNHLFTNEEIQRHIHIDSKMPYSSDKIRETIQSIKDYYGRNGYIDTSVYESVQLKESEPVYDVHFTIDENEQYRIGLIKVFGNSQTKTNVILRESLLVPGEVFDARKLRATQDRLQNMGYFKNVNVYAVRNSEDSTLGNNYRDVYIEVEETYTGSANISLGMSSVNDVTGGLEITEKNFNIKGLFTIFSKGPSELRGGGEYFHIAANFGAKQQNYLISWMDPYFRDSLWRLGVEGSITSSKLISKDYKTKTYGGSLFTSYPITSFWTYSMKYRVRDSHTKVSADAGEKARKEAESNGVISAFSASLGFDSTDNAYKAHRGLRSAVEGEFVGLGGDFTFFKFGLVNTLYLPLWKNGTMRYRANLMFIEPVGHTDKNEVPLSERYFMGGELVRGYKPYILGPRFSREKDPTGGISSAFFSMEYNHEFHKLLDGFLFFDAGSISMHHFAIRKLNTSVGAGLRLQISNRLPMMVGYGYPINPSHHNDEQRVFFSMVGLF